MHPNQPQNRKVNRYLSVKECSELYKDFENNIPTCVLVDKYNISKSAIKRRRQEYESNKNPFFMNEKSLKIFLLRN